LGRAPVGSVDLLQIARDALLDLCHAPLHLARVKFLSRWFTALNLLPSIATLACVSSPIVRHNAMWSLSGPLELSYILRVGLL
jgi:hypothetical protein